MIKKIGERVVIFILEHLRYIGLLLILIGCILILKEGPIILEVHQFVHAVVLVSALLLVGVLLCYSICLYKEYKRKHEKI